MHFRLFAKKGTVFSLGLANLGSNHEINVLGEAVVSFFAPILTCDSIHGVIWAIADKWHNVFDSLQHFWDEKIGYFGCQALACVRDKKSIENIDIKKEKQHLETFGKRV